MVYADYGQFYIRDLDAYDEWMTGGAASDPDLPAAGWTHQAVHEYRIGVESHSISVGTARTDLVQTAFLLHNVPPITLRETAEHVVEADLAVKSATISVFGCTEQPGPEHRITVPPMLYRVRVSYVPIDPPANPATDNLGDHLQYWLDMWPTAHTAPTIVLRQGPIPWAG